jgi:hypothetical protein
MAEALKVPQTPLEDMFKRSTSSSFSPALSTRRLDAQMPSLLRPIAPAPPRPMAPFQPMAPLQPMGPPPAPVNIPPFQPPTSSRSATNNPSSPVFLRRGQDSGDTPTTAAARRARDVDRRNRRHRAHEEEVSSTPPLLEFRRRLLNAPSSSARAATTPSRSQLQLDIPPMTPYGMEDPESPSPLLHRRGSLLSIRGRRSSQGSSRSGSRPCSLSPREEQEWFYCMSCHFPQSNYFFAEQHADGKHCKYCYNASQQLVDGHDRLVWCIPQGHSETCSNFFHLEHSFQYVCVECYNNGEDVLE